MVACIRQRAGHHLGSIATVSVPGEIGTRAQSPSLIAHGAAGAKARSAQRIDGMHARIGYLWHQVVSSFWLVPSLLLVLAIAVSVATLAIDATLGRANPAPVDWLYGGSPEGARLLLSTVAGR
jgi:uncharacterized membrane protein